MVSLSKTNSGSPIREMASVKGKGKGKTKEGKPVREMTFKAEVSIANDKDYQGPYLSGKTDGGGNWEAELIK